MLTIPNFLTLLRIVAVPVFLILVNDGRYGAAFGLFLAAGVTDAADGVIARLTGQHSELGASLDPLADKLLLVSSFVMLTFIGVFPAWLMILVLTRDVVILAGYLAIYFLTTPIEVRPSPVGKFNTFLEMLAVGFALVTVARPDLPMALVNQATWYATACTIAVSGIHYVYTGLLWYQRQGTPNSPPGPGGSEP
ncbi:CDP-alcohol phosphatidyltransferase family protein [Candidatus Binatia bacterium]|nr:CDP-alcohol phosphatidyltransferase family protein [Candidatus Binatia bacterium]